jgi:hypothetical protein
MDTELLTRVGADATLHGGLKHLEIVLVVLVLVDAVDVGGSLHRQNDYIVVLGVRGDHWGKGSHLGRKERKGLERKEGRKAGNGVMCLLSLPTIRQMGGMTYQFFSPNGTAIAGSALETKIFFIFFLGFLFFIWFCFYSFSTIIWTR